MRKYRLSEQTRQYCYEEEHGKQKRHPAPDRGAY